MMCRRLIAASTLVVLLLLAGAAQAASATVETRHLIANDATGTLSESQLQGLAEEAQSLLERLFAFWPAESGLERFGKIRVLFDAARRGNYSCVFYWQGKGNERVRAVRVFGFEGGPQMMAHKLTSAIFPQKDKLLRNMMGILAEVHIGSPLTFPRCGYDSDDWVLALLKTKSYIPLGELGPDHESWGMKDAGDGKLQVFDRPRQHKSYAEAGSFGEYLFRTYGVGKILRLQRLSQEKERPWQDVFGLGLQELEANWLKALREGEKAREANVATVSQLFQRNPRTACTEAQRLTTGKR